MPGLILCAVVFVGGCAARVPVTDTAPGRAGTPIEQAMAYNASLADANQAIAATAIQLSSSGAINQTITSNITSVNFTVADADKQITSILNAIAQCQVNAAAAKTSCAGNAAQLNTLITRIEANANTLVTSGDLGIKDSASQKKIVTSGQVIVQMAGLVLSTLQGAHLLQ
jgi:hypothetical protein